MMAGAGQSRRDSVPMRLYYEAKQVGAWNPRHLDLAQDARDWARLTVVEREVLLRLLALFQVAEESMTRDLLPFLITVVRENRQDEELFLTTFLSDEAEHIEFFRRILHEICRHAGDLLRYQTPSFQKLFSEKLPNAMRALLTDASPRAQAEALVTYTLVGEGVLGDAGYHVFATALEGAGLMPGFREGLRLARADEDRHMAYGLFVLSRLVAEDAGVWDPIGRRMEELLPHTLGIVNEFFEPYDQMPFGLSLEATVEARWPASQAGGPRSRRRSNAASAPRAVLGVDETVRRVLAWVRELAQPTPVEVRREGPTPICTFQVGTDGASALLITKEVLDHHASGEIIAALSARGVPRRLQQRSGLPVTFLRVGGKIVVQASPAPVDPL